MINLKDKLIDKINHLEQQTALLEELYKYLSYLEQREEQEVLMKASEKSLKKVWNQSEDDVYNKFIE